MSRLLDRILTSCQKIRTEAGGLQLITERRIILQAPLRDPGWIPKSPKPSEPQYDLAWTAHEMLFVCEVKSLTPDNESVS